MIICIDAGHGGNDNGAVSSTRCEKNDNLKFCKELEKKLKLKGIKVIMTRTEDKDIDLSERASIANESFAELFISIHRNSFSSNGEKGIEVWVYGTKDKVSELFADNLLSNLESVGISSNRGTKYGNYLIFRETNMPSVILELGFITSDVDNEFFDKKFDKYVSAVSDSIINTFNFMKLNEFDNSTFNEKYFVQVKGFSSVESICDLVEELNLRGHICNISEHKKM